MLANQPTPVTRAGSRPPPRNAAQGPSAQRPAAQGEKRPPTQSEKKRHWREEQRQEKEQKNTRVQQQQDKAELYQEAVRTQLAATSALDAVDYNVMEKAMLAVLALFASAALVFASLSYTGEGGATQAGHQLRSTGGISIEENRITLSEIPVGSVLGNPRTTVDTTRHAPSSVPPLLPGALFVGGPQNEPLNQIPLAGPNRVMSSLNGVAPGWALSFDGSFRTIPNDELSTPTIWMPPVNDTSRYLVSVQPHFVLPTPGVSITQRFDMIFRIRPSAVVPIATSATFTMEIYRALVDGLQIMDPAPADSPDAFMVTGEAYTANGSWVAHMTGFMTLDVTRTLLTCQLESPVQSLSSDSLIVCLCSGSVAVEPIPL